MAEPKIDYQMESGNAHRVEPRVDPGGFLARPTGDPDRSERAFHVPAEQMGVQLAVALVGTSYLKTFVQLERSHGSSQVRSLRPPPVHFAEKVQDFLKNFVSEYDDNSTEKYMDML
eukprot:8538946-Pyramimonas_sp.AAC.1